MKLASLCVAALVVLMGLALVTGDGSAAALPDPNQQSPVLQQQYALVPMTGRELIDSMLADEQAGESNALPRDRRSRGPRSPEDQARGLSGSA